MTCPAGLAGWEMVLERVATYYRSAVITTLRAGGGMNVPSPAQSDLLWLTAGVFWSCHGQPAAKFRPLAASSQERAGLSVTTYRRAVYGSIVIPRGLCPDCHDWAFVIKGQFACCDLPVDEEEVDRSDFERMSEGGYKRRTPSLEDRRRILSAQDNRCFYCGTVFGDIAACSGRDPRMLRPVWDHVEPFAWQANNQRLNFVAACSICNGIKGSRMFESKEAARIYVWHRRKVRGWATATEAHPESGQEVCA